MKTMYKKDKNNTCVYRDVTSEIPVVKRML